MALSIVYFAIQILQSTKLLVSLCAHLLYSLVVVLNCFTNPNEFIITVILCVFLLHVSYPCLVQNRRTKFKIGSFY